MKNISKIKVLAAIAIFLLAPGFNSLFAQQSALIKPISFWTNESVYVHANATTFVTGETLLYKLYCIEPNSLQPSSVSKIAYVELIAADQKKIARQKLYLQNGTGQGDFFIPTTAATGAYKLVAYTNWTLNKTANRHFEIDVFVINPFETTAATASSGTEKVTELQSVKTPAATTPATPFDIRFDKPSYGARELVKLSPVGVAGNYSISVRKNEVLPSITPLSAAAFSKINDAPFTPNVKSADFRIPELRGELISGSITSKSGAPVSGVTITISAADKSFGLKVAQTDANGKFYATLDKIYPTTAVNVQVLDKNRDDFVLKVEQQNVSLPLRFANEIQLDPSIRKQIEARSVASQIENAYSAKKTDSLTALSYKLFYDPLAKDYVLDDYTRFPSFRETIVEVVEEMYYTQEDGKYQLHLRDYSSQVKLAEPALVLVDGFPVQEIDELFEYRMENVYKISIVPGGYYYGAAVFSGVINIVTKNQDYTTKSKGDFIQRADILRPAAPKVYYKQDYSNKAKYERIPDYRQQLYWNPKFNVENAADQSFYTSDIKGVYDVVIEGFTNEGEPVSVKKQFEVK